MTDRDPEAEAIHARIHSQIEDAQARAVKAATVRDEIEALRHVETSPGREVSVEVDSMGRVTSLSFGDEASGLPLEELAATVLTTINAAWAQAGAASMQKIEEAFGAESETAAVMRGTFVPPTPPATDEGPQPPAPGQGPILSRH